MPHGLLNGSDYSDEALIEQVTQHGDRTAFTQLYDRYAPLIYTLAIHMVGRGEAEEMTQEIFLRLWRRAERYDVQRGRFKHWFISVARNYMRDELRRQRAQPIITAEDIDDILQYTADTTADVPETAWHRERNAALQQALKTLPSAQRRAILLAYFGGVTQSAIAQQLGWPLGTVKKRIRLGMQKLRAALQQDQLFLPADAADVRADVRAEVHDER